MSSPNLIEAELVILADNLAAGQAFSLSTNAPTIIRAWRVEVRGVAKSAGQDVTIISNQVEFFGPDGAIDSSGIDAPKMWAPGNKPVVPSEPSTKGTDGQPGADGSDAGNVSIYAVQIKGAVTVRALGGAGGRGQDGGDGSPAGPYSGPDGGTVHVRGENSQVVNQPCQPPTGHQGQQGGAGGKAGAPGKCGRGGNLDIWIPSSTVAPTIVVGLAGGSAPEPAAPGNPGQGGPGGPGGICEFSFPTGPPGSPEIITRSQPGPQGPQGKSGAAAEDQTLLPTRGADGLLNGKSANANPIPPCHVLTDLVLSANCSVPQLWSILIAAETNYVNDKFDAAAPQLLWVASMAKLLAPASPDSGH